MDELLRSRKLGSAAARRRKAQERESNVEETQKHKLNTLLYGYGYCSDEEEISEDGEEDSNNTFSPVAEGDAYQTTSNVTPSTTRSSSTDDIPSPPHIDVNLPWPKLDTQSTEMRSPVQNDLIEKPETLEHTALPNSMQTPAAVAVVLQSTLHSRSDFAFDLYSADFALSDPELEEDQAANHATHDTPVEVATPIAYSQVRARPSMINIRNPSSSASSRRPSVGNSISSSQPSFSTPKSSKRPSLASTHRSSPSVYSRASSGPRAPSASYGLMPPPSYNKRNISSGSLVSGYPACEATPIDVTPAPPLPKTKHQHVAIPMRERSEEDAVQKVPATNYHSKKSSVMLQRANLLRLSSLNSIKSYIKESNTSTRDSIQSRPTTAASGPDTNINTFTTPHPETVPQRVSRSPPPTRPRTATYSSTKSWGENSVTALPIPPEPPMPIKASTFDVARKKSFSALRSRSNSIGKALRSASSSVMPNTPHDPFPPQPSISLSLSRKASVDLFNFPLPPPSPLMPANYGGGSIRSSRMMASPKVGAASNLGLGLYTRSRGGSRIDLTA